MTRTKPPPGDSLLGQLFDAYAKPALARAARGAVDGAKREFSPDGARAALRALDACLTHAEGEQKDALLDEIRELVEKHENNEENW